MKKKYQKAIEINEARLMRLEEPGKAHDFGIPASILKDISLRYSMEAFLEGKALDPAEFGQNGMEAVITALKGPGDRTWEMVKRISIQTGVVFPHHIQYLVEAYLLATHPTSAYSIYESTPRSLWFFIKGCPCDGKDEVPCESLCTSAFLRAGKESGLSLTVSVTKSNGCEVKISPALST